MKQFKGTIDPVTIIRRPFSASLNTTFQSERVFQKCCRQEKQKQHFTLTWIGLTLHNLIKFAEERKIRIKLFHLVWLKRCLKIVWKKVRQKQSNLVGFQSCKDSKKENDWKYSYPSLFSEVRFLKHYKP